jgi:thiamine biosynthesis lipoprotein
MSTYDSGSELSCLNRAATGERVPLSGSTVEVLEEARRLSERTGGAFDVTVRPLMKLWESSARRDRVPSAAELKTARRRMGLENLDLGPDSATKHLEALEISLDAIAKGYAIHRAVEAMRGHGLTGGLVDVGGDIECFGRPLDGRAWRIAVQHPRSADRLLTLELGGQLPGRAVCTSGDYRRYMTIAGRRYSHIIDPRSGRPAEAAASVTVIGPDAFQADGWATALSVLGPNQGLARLPVGNDWQALFVIDEAAGVAIRKSNGFDRYVAPD